MNLSPFYKVENEYGFDYTPFITSFQFEDCKEEESLLTLTLTGIDVNFIDSSNFQTDLNVVFKFGYIDGAVSPLRYGTIKNISPSFDKIISAQLQICDKGYLLKRDTSKIIYKEKTYSEIVKEICSKYGLILKAEKTDKKITFPQSGKSFYCVCKEMAELSGKEFYIIDNIAHFKKRDLSQISKKTIYYGSDRGNLIGFYPDAKQLSPDAKGINIDGLDDLNKPVNNVFNASNSQETGLGDDLVYYDADANELNGKESDDKTKAGKNLILPNKDIDEINEISKKKTQDAKLNDLRATCVLPGNIFYGIDSVYTVNGVGKRFGGNYYCDKIVHSIESGSSFRTELRLLKNATGKPLSKGKEENVTDKNKTIGQDNDKVKKSIDIINYDENAIEKNV